MLYRSAAKFYRGYIEGLGGKTVGYPAASDEISLCQMLDTACVSGVLLKMTLFA